MRREQHILTPKRRELQLQLDDDLPSSVLRSSKIVLFICRFGNIHNKKNSLCCTMVFSTTSAASTAFQWQLSSGNAIVPEIPASQALIPLEYSRSHSSFDSAVRRAPFLLHNKEQQRPPASAFWRSSSRLRSRLRSSRRDDEYEFEYNEPPGINDAIDHDLDDDTNADAEKEFILKELAHLESLQGILSELEDYKFAEMRASEDDGYDDDDDDQDDDEYGDLDMLWDKDTLDELLGGMAQDEDDFEGQDDDDDNNNNDDMIAIEKNEKERKRETAAASLERALLQGVVPVSAGVGSACLPGDWGFDPLNLATKDYFRSSQTAILNLLPSNGDNNNNNDSIPQSQQVGRPKALILRDYREAEIRHGRLAMLAAIFWPLQEMLDRLILSKEQFGPLIYGPVTLPYFPLAMTAIMLLLGYLDIYSQAIKDMDKIGEAFMPGECFWDPLKILEGATDGSRRNMQERELFNGRMAMIAVAAYTWEEAATHLPVIMVGSNDLLFLPAYEVPFIQEWLDEQFSSHDPESAFITPSNVDAALKQAILEQMAESQSDLN
jgi:light-harvesting complex I chlorophyll a/b binding protein 1